MDSDLSDILQMLGGLGSTSAPSPAKEQPTGSDIFSEGRIINILQTAFSAFGAQNKNDERARLLLALRPFLSEARARRIDSAVTAMRIADVAKVAIYGEGEHHV